MATVNTKNEWKEDFIDKLIDIIFEDYPDFNPSIYQKKLNSNTGQIEQSGDGNLVLYQEDYQQYSTLFDTQIETLSSCFCDGTFIQNDENQTICNSTYTTIDAATQIEWQQEGLDPDSGIDAWILQFTNILNCGMSVGDTNFVEAGSSITIDDNVLTFLSQFIPFDSTTPSIDSEKAKEILDSSIFELIPRQITRQERINKVFSEIDDLIGDVPEFNFDVDSDGINDTWNTNLETNQDNHSTNNDIIFNPDDGNIVRLDRTAEKEASNRGQTIESLRNTLNTYLTDIDKKVDPEIVDERPEYEEKAPGYIKIRNLNQSIIIRNQEGSDVGLIGGDENNPKWLETGFTVTMWVKFLTKKQGGTLFNFGNPYRKNNPKGFSLETFSIHSEGRVRDDKPYTWKEYVDCKTEFTAFTSGNEDTYVEEAQIHMDYCIDVGVYDLDDDLADYDEYYKADHDYFENSDYERFIRLVVREAPTETYPRGALRDSHFGVTKGKEGTVSRRIKTADPYGSGDFLPGSTENQFSNGDDPVDGLSNTGRDDTNALPDFNGTIPTAPLWTLGNASNENYDRDHYYPNKVLSNYTRVPIDFNEWFFIVANYNPNIDEDTSLQYRGSCGDGDDCAPNALTSLQYYSDFWRGHVNRGGYVLQEGDPILDSNDILVPGDSIGSFTHYSGYGSRCKVEFISKSDLLRARGYKT